MNILFVSDFIFNPIIGGTERVTDILSRELVNVGYKVFYLCGPVSNSSYLDYDFPAEVHLLPEPGGYDNNVNCCFLKEIVSRCNIDIVINQRGWVPYFDRVIDLNIPVVNVVHTTLGGFVQLNMNLLFRHEKDFIGYAKYSVKIAIYPIYIFIKWIHFWHILLSHYRHIAKTSKAIIFLSNHYAELFNKIITNISTSCYVGSIPNPTPLPAQYEINEKEKILLYVGRLTRAEKRPDRLLKVWERLHLKFLDWKLVFVGDGEERLVLEEYAYKYNLKNVTFVGEKRNVNDYYKKASFICLTSNFEGWGMSLVEGMSYGCVPIVFNSFQAASDIIEDSVDGILVRPYSIKEYSNKLEEIMLDDSIRAQMSKAASYKALLFSPANIMKKWDALFNRLISS